MEKEREDIIKASHSIAFFERDIREAYKATNNKLMQILLHDILKEAASLRNRVNELVSSFED